jgi:hypothetical protein
MTTASGASSSISRPGKSTRETSARRSETRLMPCLASQMAAAAGALKHSSTVDSMPRRFSSPTSSERGLRVVLVRKRNGTPAALNSSIASAAPGIRAPSSQTVPSRSMRRPSAGRRTSGCTGIPPEGESSRLTELSGIIFGVRPLGASLATERGEARRSDTLSQPLPWRTPFWGRSIHRSLQQARRSARTGVL